MKVQNINLFNFYNFQKKLPASQPANESDFNYNKALHPQEVLGRSQINFTGGNFQFSENDRKFLDSVASNLRLSKENKKLLEDITASYLEFNDQTSFDYLEDDDKAEEQGEYCERIRTALNFSDNDLNIFTADFINRIFYYYKDEEYKPIERKYDKDLEVVDHIFEKYQVAENTKLAIFDTMKMEAEAFGYDTVFDIFKSENEPQNSIAFQIMSKNFGESFACNVFLDFVEAASKDEEKRHAEVDKTKLQRMYNDFQGDVAITRIIAENFGMDNDNVLEDIFTQIKKRRSEDKNISQIAFEIADKYNLPLGAEKTIEETIINLDHIKDLLMNKK